MYSVHVADAKKPNSSIRRSAPGTTTGAEPDRDGSPGTAKVPQSTAASRGAANAVTIRQLSSRRRQPHSPRTKSAQSSRRNLIARFSGCDPKLHVVVRWRDDVGLGDALDDDRQPERHERAGGRETQIDSDSYDRGGSGPQVFDA